MTPSLQGIFRLMKIPHDLATDAQNHRSVPLEQGREGKLRGRCAASRELLQQLPIRVVGR